MFYLVFILLTINLFFIFRIFNRKRKEEFRKKSANLLKILAVFYCFIMFLTIFLPDAFTISYDKDVAKLSGKEFYTIIRWFSMVGFAVIPLSVFFDNRTIRNIAIIFVIPVTIMQIILFPQYMADFTSVQGRGLNSIPIISEEVKNFLLNETFRSVVFGVVVCLQIIIPFIMMINEEHFFKLNSVKEIFNFIFTLPFIIICSTPIYVPQHLFGYTDLIFDAFTLPQYIWMASVVVLIILLYFIFRNQDNDTKKVVLFVLALSLFMQYNQMFGAISINIKRLPLQLCNIAPAFILLSLITKNKMLCNFTVLINVIGATLALIFPSLDGKGFFYLYNMHFIFEHTNIIVVPILASLFGIFARLDKNALKDCILGFTIYYIIVICLGTIFNGIAVKTGNSFWNANYMFVFDKEEAVKVLPFIGKLFDFKFEFGNFTIYPVIKLVIYLFFVVLCFVFFIIIKIIYAIKDKIFKKDDDYNNNNNNGLFNNPLDLFR